MESALYTGWVRHRRFEAPQHAFRVPLCMAWLDLAELDRVFAGSRLASASRPALLRFRRSDHLGDPARPLADCVRDAVQGATGRRPAGPVRLLTLLRHAGIGFNPVSFHYCLAEDGEGLEAVVADVTNTPWRERHAYVITDPERRSGRLRASHAKTFHVSPFMGMDRQYAWAFGPPARSLVVHVESREDGRTGFDATLALARRELTPATLRHAALRYPLQPARVLAGIYLHAFRLWLRRAPFHPHPRRLTPPEGART